MHSFISHACVERLGLCTTELPYDMVVSTSTNEPIITSRVCLKCPIIVEGRSFVADLICLPLAHLDVILGMNWLSTNHIFLDCKEKMLVFGANLGVCLVLTAELKAIYLGWLKLAWSRGFRKIRVDSYSLLAVKFLLKKE